MRRAQIRLRVAIPVATTLAALGAGVLGHNMLMRLSAETSSVLLDTALLHFLWWMLGLIVLSAVVGIALAQSITAPLQRIVKQMEKMERGEQVDGLEVDGGGEFAELSARFNTMLTTLRARALQRSRGIMEQFSGALMTFDRNRRVVAINSAAGELLDLDPLDVLDQTAGSVFDRIQILGDLEAKFLDLHESGESFENLEIDLETITGEKKRLIVTGTIDRDESGVITGSVLNLRDRDEIEAFHNRIRQSEQIAAVSTFASGVAHEIRNPLASIKAFAQLLSERVSDDEKLVRYSEVIQTEVNRLDSIVSELQAFTMLSREGQMTCDMALLVREAIALAIHRQGEVGGDLATIHDSLEPGSEVVANADWLREAFFHVIENALEWTGKGDEVRISLSQRGAKCIITVENTGSTIADEDLPQIFTPFFSTKATGPGLGLAVARQVITRHQGNIDVTSEPDCVRVTITLPGGNTADA